MASSHTASEARTKRGSDSAKASESDTSLNEAVAGERVRVIKKYPNRRLYDTHTSAYITLTEVKALVVSGAPFVVRDAKTAEDLTRSILLQIILEEETVGAPLFSEAVLAGIIRFYGQATQSLMGPLLERNIQMLGELQKRMGAQAATVDPQAWQQMLSAQSPTFQNWMDQSQQTMQQVQEQLQRNSEQWLQAMGLKR